MYKKILTLVGLISFWQKAHLGENFLNDFFSILKHISSSEKISKLVL